jgi:hypothetical protein
MSTRDFETEREQREWEAQERALVEERAGARARGDVNVAQYRLIARALRRPQLAPLPSDFAARTAARAMIESRAASERVEVWLERGLIALLLVAGGVALSVFNGEWFETLSFGVPERASLSIQTLVSWSIAIAGCVGISSGFALALARKP